MENIVQSLYGQSNTVSFTLSHVAVTDLPEEHHSDFVLRKNCRRARVESVKSLRSLWIIIQVRDVSRLDQTKVLAVRL